MKLLHGHAPEVLRSLPAGSVHCVVTSPPYWGLRAYGTEPQVWGGDPEHAHEWVLKLGAFCACGAWRGELGLEPTPELYVEHMVEVFREVRRGLRPDGVLWLNIGDSYANDGKWGGSSGGKHAAGLHGETGVGRERRETGLKPKDLVGIPWRLAFALQADGWWLRSEVIWHKPNPMPESVTDRPTKAHEQVFLLSKSASYFYDAEAIKEAAGGRPSGNRDGFRGRQGGAAFMPMSGGSGSDGWVAGTGRNARSVWTIAPQPSPVAHFATFPQELAERCILAGTSERGACSTCGAPWVRMMERTGHTNKREPARAFNNSPTKTDSTGWAPLTRDSGRWAPTCEHTALVVPCVVLDPFSGTGTTGKAALKLDRDYIGIDLHPEHTRTAQRRLTHQVDGPLFA